MVSGILLLSTAGVDEKIDLSSRKVLLSKHLAT